VVRLRRLLRAKDLSGLDDFPERCSWRRLARVSSRLARLCRALSGCGRSAGDRRDQGDDRWDHKVIDRIRGVIGVIMEQRPEVPEVLDAIIGVIGVIRE
jgi:hypothetical protein